MVERYLPAKLQPDTMVSNPDGNWVRYADYADLQRQLAEVRAELKIADESIALNVKRFLAAEAERDRLAAENEALRKATEECLRVLCQTQDRLRSKRHKCAIGMARAALDTAKGLKK